jgi:hypothetical protein
MHTHGEWIV